MNVPYTLTNDSLTVVLDGETYVTRKGTLNFDAARRAVLDERWEDLPPLFSVGRGIMRWVNDYNDAVHGDQDLEVAPFVYDETSQTLSYLGRQIPSDLHARIIAMAEKGEDPTPFMRFWENLAENPSYRSVNQLYPFLHHKGIPIDADGMILAYKGITRDFLDKFTKTIDNSVGAVVKVDRHLVNDDPDEPCSSGLHAGAEAYAKDWAGPNGRVVIVRINPRDVVSIPKDSSYQKMRCCRYEVIGLYGDRLSSTVHREDEDTDEPTTTPQSEASATPVTSVAATSADPPTGARREAWAAFDNLTEAELHQQGIDALRKYARHALNIVGASKIRGGKDVLIARILDARS